jgi:hypothetical protein
MKNLRVLSFRRTLFIIDISVAYFIGTCVTAQKMPTGYQKNLKSARFQGKLTTLHDYIRNFTHTHIYFKFKKKGKT